MGLFACAVGRHRHGQGEQPQAGFSADGENNSDNERDELQAQLRDELLFFAGLGIRSALRYPRY